MFLCLTVCFTSKQDYFDVVCVIRCFKCLMSFGVFRYFILPLRFFFKKKKKKRKGDNKSTREIEGHLLGERRKKDAWESGGEIIPVRTDLNVIQ
jgi:hypothetical protein